MPRLFSSLILCLALAGTTAYSDETGNLPKARFPDLNGNEHSLQEWHGKIVLLNFWASWCVPCLAEIKDLIHYQTKYADSGLQIIGLGFDQQVKLSRMAQTLGINYPVLIGGAEIKRDLLSQWGNDEGVIPFTIFYDPAGNRVHQHVGILDEASLDEILLPLLDKK